MSDTNADSWVEAVIAKRTPDVLLILSQLIEAGLAHGICSGNDVRHRDIASPNTIGATFKTLRQLGFTQTDTRIPAKHDSQHGRPVFVWLLVEPLKAKAFLKGVRLALTGRGLYQAQMELL